jgi:hypothetical protein
MVSLLRSLVGSFQRLRIVRARNTDHLLSTLQFIWSIVLCRRSLSLSVHLVSHAIPYPTTYDSNSIDNLQTTFRDADVELKTDL